MSAFGPKPTYLHLPLAAPMSMLPMGLVPGANCMPEDRVDRRLAAIFAGENYETFFCSLEESFFCSLEDESRLGGCSLRSW
jgi:hypothetical protein